MEVILKPIRAEKSEKRRKLMELERLVRMGGDLIEIQKLREEVGKNGIEKSVKQTSEQVMEKVREVKKKHVQNKVKVDCVKKQKESKEKFKKTTRIRANKNVVEREVALSLVQYTNMVALGMDDKEICFIMCLSYGDLTGLKNNWGKSTVEINKDAKAMKDHPVVIKYAKKKGRSENKTSVWKEIAENNGINEETFNTRLKRGWEPMEAATKPSRKYNGGN